MKFLVVTPNFNSGAYLARSFNRMIAAKSQCDPAHLVTWIILDACSRDESVIQLRRLISNYGYHNLRDNKGLDIRVVVKRDGGMYDGINNGLEVARAEGIGYDYFFWLNSDDYVCLNSFDSIATSAIKVSNPKSMIIGRGIDIDENDAFLHDQAHPVIEAETILSGDFNYTSGHWVKAESCVFPKSLVDAVGPFNASVRLAGDFDYIVRCARVAPPEFDDECYGREFRRRAGQQSANLQPYEIERRKVFGQLGLANRPNQTHPTLGDKDVSCIYFYPDYTSGNSYQASLYEGFRSKGYPTIEALREDGPKLGSTDVFHVHWLNDIIRREPEEAAEALEWMKRYIKEAKEAGAKIIWTVHNIFSHEAKNRELERSAYEFLSEQCDRCHMHDALVVYEFHDYYKILPWGRIRIAEHGAYPQAEGELSGAVATELGLSKGDKYIVIPGQLRRYKNIPLLSKAIEYLRLAYPSYLVCLLGQPHPELSLDEIQSVTSQVNLVHSTSRLSDDDYARLVRDSCFALLTYTNISTSGSAIHAFSQGTRVVAPRLGTLQSYITCPSRGYLYDNDDQHSLEKAIDLLIADDVKGDSFVMSPAEGLADWQAILPRILV